MTLMRSDNMSIHFKNRHELVNFIGLHIYQSLNQKGFLTSVEQETHLHGTDKPYFYMNIDLNGLRRFCLTVTFDKIMSSSFKAVPDFIIALSDKVRKAPDTHLLKFDENEHRVSVNNNEMAKIFSDLFSQIEPIAELTNADAGKLVTKTESTVILIMPVA